MDLWLLDGGLSEALRPMCVAGRVCLASGVWTEARAVGFRRWGEGEEDLDIASGWCSFCAGFSPAALLPSAGEKRKCKHILIHILGVKAECVLVLTGMCYKQTNHIWIQLCSQMMIHLPVGLKKETK